MFLGLALSPGYIQLKYLKQNFSPLLWFVVSKQVLSYFLKWTQPIGFCIEVQINFNLVRRHTEGKCLNLKIHPKGKFLPRWHSPFVIFELIHTFWDVIELMLSLGHLAMLSSQRVNMDIDLFLYLTKHFLILLVWYGGLLIKPNMYTKIPPTHSLH